jgi:hypothetical protein
MTKKQPGIAVERNGRHGKLVVSINGRPAKMDQKKAALLACLNEALGCVIPHEQLFEVIGCGSPTPEGRQHVLRQHLHVLKDILSRAGYVIARAVRQATSSPSKAARCSTRCWREEVNDRDRRAIRHRD